MISLSTTSRRFRWLPLAAVTLLMGALVATTVVVELRTTTLRRELNNELLPSAVLSERIAFHLSREMGQLRAYALLEQGRFLERYAQFRGAEEEAWARLLGQADRLAPDVAKEIRDLRSATLRWHELTIAASPATPPPLPEAAALVADTDLYETILNRFNELNAGLDGRIRTRIAALERVETVQTLMTLVLAFLAVVAAAGATWLVGRTQALAAEADRRREEVQRLSEGRVRLMRGLTHDVKNPLSAAVGYAHLLELKAGDRLAPENRQWLVGIRTTVGRATAILDDLLELSRAEAGRLPLRLESVSVRAIVEEVATEEAPQFEAAGVRFALVVPHALPLVRADRGRLQQILGNLLGNARKYTPAGGHVTLRVIVRSDAPLPRPGPWLAVDVIDTGPGIPQDRQETIFDEFTRLEPGTAPGLGLGLAISRRLAVLMGGDLTVESRSGAGSTFTMWLPVAGEGVERDAA